jgi:putative tryptophan/tyrosine transport system substrate-binding protein
MGAGHVTITLSRRKVVAALGGSAAWPLAARAQSPQWPLIGVITGFAANDPEAVQRISAFLEELRRLGWTEDRNVRVVYRWGAGDPQRIRTDVYELVGSAPDVIVANSGLVVEPLARATRTISIVFVQVTDPVGSG